MFTKIKIDGLYVLQFVSHLGILGTGLVMLSDGKFRGNDSDFRWVGKYEVINGTLEAQVRVKQFGSGLSIFGKLSEFNLVLSGPADREQMTLVGFRPEEPSNKLKVIMSRKSDTPKDH